ncbi:MAG: lytic transglycosylase domain-containing protein [Cyclobacteriaceae bacterium]|nr:lytic transglycosylase domain-containing protein [Cyclobacteriaceae bacterium]
MLERNFPLLISLLALAVALGYVRYSNDRIKKLLAEREQAQGIQDGSLPPAEWNGAMPPYQAVSYDLPTNVMFAGEPVPLEIPDVLERLDRELQINIYLHSSTIFLIKRANRWLPQMQEILRKHNIPDDFKYLPLIESGLLNDTSPKEAVGYWQILKTSGRELGLEIEKEVDERYDPLKATEAACKYLNNAYRKFGNWTLVAASYNRGIAGVGRALENQQVDNFYDLHLVEETSRYVFRIIAIKEIIENPAKYGFNVNPKHLYQQEQLRYVEVNETVPDLIRFSKQQGVNYKLLKRYNPWLRDDRLTVKRGKVYRIALPVSN